jgi:hypothetical protein
MREKPPVQIEIPFGIHALRDDLKEKLTTILVELKKRYDKEMELNKPPLYGQWGGTLDYNFDHLRDIQEIQRETHRQLATAHAHAYFLVVKTFKLTEREAWFLIKPYLEEGSKPPTNYYNY